MLVKTRLYCQMTKLTRRQTLTRSHYHAAHKNTACSHLVIVLLLSGASEVIFHEKLSLIIAEFSLGMKSPWVRKKSLVEEMPEIFIRNDEGRIHKFSDLLEI